jgi:transcriptional regulator with XRE-family HTH domain
MPLPKLADMSGVPIEKIDHYELGKNEIVLDHMLRIACALEVEVGTLLLAPANEQLRKTMQTAAPWE